MKKYLLAILFLSFFSFHLSPLSAKPNRQVVVLRCDLHCQGCCDKIMRNIAYEKGVRDLQCDLKTKTVTVTYDADKTNVPALLLAFDKIGKPATVQEDKQPQAAPADKDAPATDAQTGATLQY